MPSKPHRIDALDGLRGLAACVVAFVYHLVHFRTGGPGPLEVWWLGFEPIRWLHRYGWLAVDLFFVLSGFVMTWKYAHAVTVHAISPRAFFVLRMSRLYPLHIATLGACIVLIALGGQLYGHNDTWHLFLNATFAQHWGFQSGFSFNGPAWSLSLEVLCYALFFALAWRWREWFPLAAAGAMIAGAILLTVHPRGLPLLTHDTGRALTAFFAGCLIASAVEAGWLRWLRWVALAHLAYFALHSIRTGTVAVDYRTFDLVVLPAVVACTLGFRAAAAFLAWRPFLFLGHISYSIYMVHVLVQMAMFAAFRHLGMPMPMDTPALACVYIAATLLIATLTYYGVELPAQRYLRSRHS